MSKELRGGEMQMVALIDCLADRYEQRVIVRRDSLLHRRLCVERLDRLDIVPVPSSVPAAVRAARRQRLLHVHEGRSVQVGAWASLFGTRFVVTRRVVKAPKSDPVTRWIYGRASATIGVSDAVSTVMRAYQPSTDVETILDYTPRIPVNESTAAELRGHFAGKVVVGHVGELDDLHKGQMVILQAARLALSQYPQLHFLMVGSGRDSQRMRDYARDLPNVEFVGRVDNVGDYYSVMDMFAFPSRAEALGSAILEAMSFGIPVIGSAIGGIPEVVDPQTNGRLFASGDAESLLGHVAEIADDRALRDRLSVGASATAASRSVEVGAAQYVAVYERVASGRQVSVSMPAGEARHGIDGH